MSWPPLATRWSTSVSYCWYNTGKVWAHKNPVEVANKRILYHEEFLQILSTRDIIKKSYSIFQFVVNGQGHFSEGVFREDDLWYPWWGPAI